MGRGERTAPMRLDHLKSEGIDVWCWCETCTHHSVIETALLIARLGPTFPIPEIARHLRCSACGSKDIHARPDWPSLGVIARH